MRKNNILIPLVILCVLGGLYFMIGPKPDKFVPIPCSVASNLCKEITISVNTEAWEQNFLRLKFVPKHALTISGLDISYQNKLLVHFTDMADVLTLAEGESRIIQENNSNPTKGLDPKDLKITALEGILK